MNCKPGTLAIVVNAFVPQNLGRIVRCVALERQVLLSSPAGSERLDSWLVDPPLLGSLGGVARLCPDCDLRPIRDPGEDAKDEMLRPLPVKETA